MNLAQCEKVKYLVALIFGNCSWGGRLEVIKQAGCFALSQKVAQKKYGGVEWEEEGTYEEITLMERKYYGSIPDDIFIALW